VPAEPSPACSGLCLLAATLLALGGLANGTRAQEMEPRAYSATPVGASFLVLAYANAAGDLLFDASSPITDASAEVSTTVLGYNHVLDVAGRQSGVTVALPYAWGEARGNVGESRAEAERSGLGDLRLKASTLLVGGPALSLAEFAARKPGPIVGASLLTVTPTGQYVAKRIVNIGANRWALKPEVGVSFPKGRWQFDAYAGVWLFGTNDDFQGRKKTQDPLASLQGHVSYTVRPRLWAALDTTYYTGGATSLAGVDDANRQNNLRVGVTVSLPVGRRQSLQFNYSRGAVTRIGGDFSIVGVALQTAWF
jgi:hypothetical protein